MTDEHQQIIDTFIASEFGPHLNKPSDPDRDREFLKGIHDKHGREEYFPDMMRAMINVAYNRGKRMARGQMDAVFPE